MTYTRHLVHDIITFKINIRFALLLISSLILLENGLVQSYSIKAIQGLKQWQISSEIKSSGGRANRKPSSFLAGRNRKHLPLSPLRATTFFGDEEDDSKYEDSDEDLEDEKFQSASGAPSPMSGDTRSQIERQQRQIDMMMEMLKNQSPSPTKVAKQNTIQSQPSFRTDSEPDDGMTIPPPLPGMFDQEGEEELLDHDESYVEQQISPQTAGSAQKSQPFNNQGVGAGIMPLAPLKAMLFIDGTWLYYSLHRRKEEHDPIVQKFGKGWQFRYRFDWNALPRIICEQFVGQQVNLGWSANASDAVPAQRPMEIVRASVFTSYKKSTDPKSFRVRMYNEMADANYDIHMLESTSNGPEKCVDISLAVEMLHYATVPSAYDVAILLSGDKDFIPALVRTRQKGRKVGITSMKTGCNRALYESPHVKDYDIVWIDDFLDELLVPLPPDAIGQIAQKVHDRGMLSAFTLTKVILDFVTQSPYDRVSSRDVGRYLKSLEFADGGTNLLDDIKVGQGGLRRFLSDRMPAAFEVIDKSRVEMATRDASDTSYWILKRHEANKVLLEEAKKTEFSPEEKKFLEDYRSGYVNSSIKEEKYYYTSEAMEFGTTSDPELNKMVNVIPPPQTQQPPKEKIDYSSYTVVRLKEICRDRGLPVSGTKAVLIERIESDDEESSASSASSTDDQPYQDTNGNNQQLSGKEHIKKYIVDLIKYYIVESRGYASSRDVGRFLATNRAASSESMTALQELKENFGGVAAFLNQQSNTFITVREASDGDPSNFSFGIKLREVKLGAGVASPPNNTGTRDRGGNYVDHQRQGLAVQTPPNAKKDEEIISAHVESLIREYLQASGGEASSRNIGRYLAANSVAPGTDTNVPLGAGGKTNALKQMKYTFGSLANYLARKEDVFLFIRDNFQSGRGGIDPPSEHDFGVRLK